MLAELHGKLSLTATQEIHRLEDALTGYVFGALKYVDRTCLKRVLQHAIPDIAWADSAVDDAALAFWPQFPGGTEPDVVATVGRNLVIFEAKLHSSFSSGDTELDSQLVREWIHGNRFAEPRMLRSPHVVAVTANYSEPSEIDAANAVISERFDTPGRVRWMSWQQLAQLLEDSAKDLDRRDQMLISDVLAVMERRGVRRVFGGFTQEDYWVVAAGTRIAADRIFPAVATFAEELLEQVAGGGLVRGTPETRIVTNRSESLRNPHLWGVTHINIPLWVDSWPKRNRAIHGLLFVQFPLTEPLLRVGFRIRINAKRKTEWHGYVPDVVAALNSSHHGHEVGIMSYPDLGTLEERIAASDLTEAWLRSAIDRAEKYLAIQRTLPLDNLTQTAAVSDLLIEDRALIEEALPLLLHEAAHA